MQRLKVCLTAVVVAILGATFALQAPALAALPVSGPWEIQPYNGINLCLEIQGASQQNSAQVQQYSCRTSGGAVPTHRRWYFETQTNGDLEILAEVSGRCMNIQGATGANNTKIIQYACASDNRDNFYVDKVFTINQRDYYEIRSRKFDGMCLNISGASVALGTDLILYRCGVAAANDLFTWSTARN